MLLGSVPEQRSLPQPVRHGVLVPLSTGLSRHQLPAVQPVRRLTVPPRRHVQLHRRTVRLRLCIGILWVSSAVSELVHTNLAAYIYDDAVKRLLPSLVFSLTQYPPRPSNSR